MDDDDDAMLERLMGNMARTIYGEHLAAHVAGLGNINERWAQHLGAADMAAILDYIKAGERLSKTLDAGIGGTDG